MSGSAVLGKPLKYWGVIRDIGLTAGFDFNAKDDQFSARVRKTALGPKISFDVPGFWDVAVARVALLTAIPLVHARLLAAS